MHAVIRKTYLLLLAVFALSLVMVVGAPTAEAASYDIDRKIRTYTYGSNASLGSSDVRDANNTVVEYAGLVGSSHSDGFWAYATYNYNPRWGGYNWWIVYDIQEMRNRGFTVEGRRTVIRHERAHTRGWGHRERPAYRNAAFCNLQDRYGNEYYSYGVPCP